MTRRGCYDYESLLLSDPDQVSSICRFQAPSLVCTQAQGPFTPHNQGQIQIRCRVAADTGTRPGSGLVRVGVGGGWDGEERGGGEGNQLTG